MKSTEFIRSLLDIIDGLDNTGQETVTDYVEEVPAEAAIEKQQYSNSPDTLVADISKVTVDAGGGVNGPKHPADIRADSISMYPQYQKKPRF